MAAGGVHQTTLDCRWMTYGDKPNTCSAARSDVALAVAMFLARLLGQPTLSPDGWLCRRR